MKLLFSVKGKSTATFIAIRSFHFLYLGIRHTVNYIITPHMWVRHALRNVSPPHLAFASFGLVFSESCQWWEWGLLSTKAFRTVKIVSTGNSLSTVALRATKILWTLRTGMAVAFIVTYHLEDAMLPVNCLS